MTPALGSIDKRGNRSNPVRYVATFDEETFAEVRDHAVRSKLSLAAAIRELVEWGLVEQGQQVRDPRRLAREGGLRLSARADQNHDNTSPKEAS